MLEDQKFGVDAWDTAVAQASGLASAPHVAPSGVAPDNSAVNVWADLNASDNSLNTRRLFGNSVDQTIARISSAGTLALYVNDRQSSVHYMLTGGGTVNATLVYDSFGQITSNSNPTFTDRYTYTGRENELAAPHLQSNRDRIVALDIGKFLSPDRVRDDETNGVRYVHNSFPNASDPSGLEVDGRESAMDTWLDSLFPDRSGRRKAEEAANQLRNQISRLQLQREQLINRRSEMDKDEFADSLLELDARIEQLTDSGFNPDQVPRSRVEKMVADGLAIKHRGWVAVVDVAPSGKQIHRYILAPFTNQSATLRISRLIGPDETDFAFGHDFEGHDLPVPTKLFGHKVINHSRFEFYRVVRFESWDFKGDREQALRGAWNLAPRKIDSVIEGQEVQRKQEGADLIVGIYRAVPFGEAWWQAGEGNLADAVISGVGDAAMLLGGGAGLLGKCKNARLAYRIAIAGETVVAGTRITQGAFELIDGDTEKALGYFGEATLRLMGVGANAIALMKVPCFPAGTPIRTADGHKPIEEIKVGDWVLSRDENDSDGPVCLKRVVQTFRNEARLWHIEVQGQTIRTTAEHPFYVRDKRWTAASRLEAGDLLATEDGRWLPVERIFGTIEVALVYNFEVTDYHTYFVGADERAFSFWVHNSCQLAPIAQLAQSAKGARASLRRAMGGVPAGHQAHHIVPWELRDHDFVKLAAKGGFGINSKANGVLLGTSTHLGSHPLYTAAIQSKLDDLLTKGLSPAQAAKELQAFVDRVRAGLLRTSAKLR